MRWAVLVGGSGTNLEALLETRPDIRVELVVSHRAGVRALEVAARFGVPAEVLLPRRYPDREAYDRALLALLEARGIEAVALAGYLRWLSPVMVDRYAGRMLNLHPSLLPAFPGLDAIRQAWEWGVRVTGVTVHLVDNGHDSGPIVLQEAVPVPPGIGLEELEARIHAVEHRLFPAAVGLVDQGRIRVQGRRVEILEEAAPSGG
ncbi:Phosphoribosylglycinamide formyltransferase [Candidatus Hydrogenisulfobacillus filiaventi]|uniref:Phosphoribosylglycinamide formyltransferase n=1 Tax=Candidatus Hydrogenisulfobacillus filiaventi TaxID=2707344 RepID=A0A6F8ZGZ0_9FIRM|nr:Phosphoribosylglycinamide formyltransferase [Candidatus Hydrogenisulfobacillus filiaventi]